MSYVELIKTTALQNNVPASIALAVAQQESQIRHYGPDGGVLRGKAGEYGIYQLMPATARDLGVDPTDPVQNIQGGVRYLKMVRNWTDSWQSALEAYNGGIGNWQRNDVSDPARRYAVQVLGRAGMPLDKPGTPGTGPTVYAGNWPAPQMPSPYAVDPMGGAPSVGQGFEVTAYNAPNTFTWPPVTGPNGEDGNKEVYLAAAALAIGLLIVLVA